MLLSFACRLSETHFDSTSVSRFLNSFIEACSKKLRRCLLSEYLKSYKCFKILVADFCDTL